MNTTLITIAPPDTDVSTMKRADLPAIWNGFHQQLTSLVDTASTLTVTDSSQTELIASARNTRLQLRRIRLDIEAKRKELTDYHLKTKQEIDKCAKWLRDKIEPLEARLEDQEKFAERQEAERKEKLRAERAALLLPFNVDVSLYNLAQMDAKAFSNLYDVSKYSHEEAQARIKAQLEEQARIREENERLRREAEIARKEREVLEAQANKERRQAEAQLQYERQVAESQRQAIAAEEKRKQDALQAQHRAEQQKREAAERELQAAKDKEAAIVAAQKAAEEKSAQAPDREKLLAFVATLKGLPFPKATTEKGREIFGAAASTFRICIELLESDSTKL